MEDILQKIYNKGQNFSKKDKELIKKAYNFTKKAHESRAKGDKPFLHPATVGLRLAEWQQNAQMISAGLLHDVVEDTDTKLSDIKKKFGDKVAFYVKGMSWSKKKINGKMVKDYEGLFKKFLQHVKKDPKIAIIKAGDMFRSEPKNPKKFVDKLKEGGYWEGFQKMINERFRGFWIPFFKEIGFNKLVKQIEGGRAKFVKEKNVKIKLYDYVSKADLNKIRSKMDKIEGLKELR